MRLGATADDASWADRIQRGLVRIATVTLLEIGCSARSAADTRCRSSAPRRSPMIGRLTSELIAGVTGQPLERVRTPG